MMAAVLVELERHDRDPGAGQGERGALLRYSAPQHQPTDPCTTLARWTARAAGGRAAVLSRTARSRACNRNIEMTPLRKVQMAPSCYSGLQENGADDGGVDERQGVFATGRPARFGGGSYHDPGCG